MAEEVKKVITVEVGKSITSVRDFKKHIEDLRGALLGLNEESDEYKTIAEQIATDQAKLNEVMSVGKKNTDAAAGSYVELNNQLKALRNQYKALSETERNSASGQAILQNITKLDTQLKDIDESMGIYTRNVGNYKQAFIDAFGVISQQVNKVNPDLGNLLSSVQRLVPAFVNLGKTAKATGSVMKAATSATGIGTIVLILGEIIAHWDSIARVVSKVLGLQNKYTKEVKDTADNMKTLADEAARTESHLRNLASIRGLSPVQQVNESVERKQKEINRLEEDVRRYTRGLQILQDENLSYQERADKFQRWWQWYGRNIFKGVDDVKEARQKVEEQLRLFVSNAEEIADGNQHMFFAITGQIQKSLEEYDAYSEKQRNKLHKELADRTQELNDELDEEAAAIERRIELYLQGDKKEEYLRTEQYQRERQSLIDHNEMLIRYRKNLYDTIESLDKERLGGILDYNLSFADAMRIARSVLGANNADLENIIATYNANRQYIIDHDYFLGQLKKEYDSDIEAIAQSRKKAHTQQRDEDKERALELLKSLKDYGKDEVQLIEEKYKEELDLLTKYGLDTTNLTNKYLDDIQEAIKNKSDDIDSLIEQIAKEIQDTWEKAFQVDLQKQEDTENAALHAADMMWTINPKTHESEVELEREKEDRIYEIKKKGYEDRIALYEEHLLLLEAGSDEYLDAERQITEAKMDLDDLGYQHAVDLEKRKREDVQLTLQKWQEAVNFAQNTVSLFGTIAGEIANYTLEYAEEGTEAYKSAQITQAVISTLSGMVGVFSQALSAYGLPWGAVVGGIGATMMGAVGAARINQIRNANSNTNISGGGASASTSVGVEPLLNQDYDLQRITNLSLQSDAYLPGNTQVYVLESDIQEVGNRVQVRENNATF